MVRVYGKTVFEKFQFFIITHDDDKITSTSDDKNRIAKPGQGLVMARAVTQPIF